MQALLKVTEAANANLLTLGVALAGVIASILVAWFFSRRGPTRGQIIDRLPALTDHELLSIRAEVDEQLGSRGLTSVDPPDRGTFFAAIAVALPLTTFSSGDSLPPDCRRR